MNLEKQLKEILGVFYNTPKFEINESGKKTDQQVLHEPFEINVHKKHFFGYLEIVILPSGDVMYAVPSHRYLCEAYLMKLKNWNREKLMEACPREYWCDYNTWLLKETGTLMVWNDFYAGTPNKKQMEVLKKLKEENLFYGELK